MDENKSKNELKNQQEFVERLISLEIRRQERIFYSLIKNYSSSSEEEKLFLEIAKERGFEIIF